MRKLSWIISLITSAFYSILVNETPSSTFSPTRGLRQGDPLSPFLFILMFEGLGRMLKVAISSNSLRGISIHGAPPNVYQQFVDDNLLFGHSSSQEACTIKFVLDTFEKASGTTLNLDKSQIFFFNTGMMAQRNII